MSETDERRQPALCRLCTAYCPIVATVQDGRVIKVKGNFDAPSHGGYSCPKGRAMPEQHYGPARLLHSMKAQGESHVPVASSEAMDDIAQRIEAIVARHGPRSVALFIGFGTVPQMAGSLIASAWMQAIGSRMIFSAGSIDKPGIQIALAYHGGWQGGQPLYAEADGWLLFGANPIVSKGPGFPAQNPGLVIKRAAREGRELIVVDPRRTETAKLADVHLQPLPGHDSTILAAMINVIITEHLYDADFVAANTEGLSELREAVAPFTPQLAAERAGLEAGQITDVARRFASYKIAGISFGTGTSFAGHSTLAEYLGLCLTSLCGHWARAGDPVRKPNILLPAYVAKAQPYPPFAVSGQGEALRVRGLGANPSGLAASAIAEEILMEGEGQIKALICLGGNPMMSFPDQLTTHRALRALDLLVTLDYEMTATGKLAHYVIAPKLVLETPGTTALVEKLKFLGTHRGMELPYAFYAPAVVDPPAGADVIEEWEFFYGLAQRMSLQLEPVVSNGAGAHVESPPVRLHLDMTNKPTSDQLLDLILQGSRVPLDEIKRHPNGKVCSEIEEIVQPRDPGNQDRLQIGAEAMMSELAELHAEDVHIPLHASSPYPFLLMSRRSNEVINSAGRSNRRLLKKPYNPLSLHPDDLAVCGLLPGDVAVVRSRHGHIHTVVEADPSLRRGVATIAQGFGGLPGEDDDPRNMGANSGRLLSVWDKYDPVSGIPRMGGLPVAIGSAVAAAITENNAALPQ